MKSFVSIRAGARRHGKTTESKKLLDIILKNDPKRFVAVFDPNNEYLDYADYSELTGDYDIFIDKCLELENSIILIEECTICLGTRSDDKRIKKLLVRAAHQNNIIAMNFHSIRAMPTYLFELATFCYIHKTADTLEQVKKKSPSPEFLECWEKVQNDDDKYSMLIYSIDERKYGKM